jgi:hypothetical protein
MDSLREVSVGLIAQRMQHQPLVSFFLLSRLSDSAPIQSNQRTRKPDTTRDEWQKRLAVTICNKSCA